MEAFVAYDPHREHPRVFLSVIDVRAAYGLDAVWDLQEDGSWWVLSAAVRSPDPDDPADVDRANRELDERFLAHVFVAQLEIAHEVWVDIAVRPGALPEVGGVYPSGDAAHLARPEATHWYRDERYEDMWGLPSLFHAFTQEHADLTAEPWRLDGYVTSMLKTTFEARSPDIVVPADDEATALPSSAPALHLETAIADAASTPESVRAALETDMVYVLGRPTATGIQGLAHFTTGDDPRLVGVAVFTRPEFMQRLLDQHADLRRASVIHVSGSELLGGEFTAGIAVLLINPGTRLNYELPIH